MPLNGPRIVSTGRGTVFRNGLDLMNLNTSTLTVVEWASKIQTVPLSRNHGRLLRRAEASSKLSRTKHAEEVIVMQSV